VTGIDRGADDRVGANTDAALTGIGLGTGIAVSAGGAVGHALAQTSGGAGVAGPTHLTYHRAIGHALSGGGIAGLADLATASGTGTAVDGGAAIACHLAAAAGAGLRGGLRHAAALPLLLALLLVGSMALRRGLLEHVPRALMNAVALGPSLGLSLLGQSQRQDASQRQACQKTGQVATSAARGQTEHQSVKPACIHAGSVWTVTTNARRDNDQGINSFFLKLLRGRIACDGYRLSATGYRLSAGSSHCSARGATRSAVAAGAGAVGGWDARGVAADAAAVLEIRGPVVEDAASGAGNHVVPGDAAGTEGDGVAGTVVDAATAEVGLIG
jgi:hypothetical protein